MKQHDITYLLFRKLRYIIKLVLRLHVVLCFLTAKCNLHKLSKTGQQRNYIHMKTNPLKVGIYNAYICMSLNLKTA